MKKLLLVLFFFMQAALLVAQNKTITGRVTDDNGKPIAEVTVTVKETLEAVTTNEAGVFSIAVSGNARTLIFSYIGKASEEVSIGNRTAINTVLKSEEKALAEVVVVGYGSQSKKRITGAVAKIGGEEFENKPFTSVDQMLQGKVPGLFSTASSGQPGSAQNVLIRGVGSITAGSAPLYVVDGIPINTGDFSRLAPAGSTNTLAGINPNDIESVSVLKDAASASIYGSRAANGVIVITTKKGKAGKSKIRVDSELGFGSVAFLSDEIKPLNRQEYFDLTREGLVNAGATQSQIDATLNSLGFNNTANEDWLDNVTRQGTTQNINVSFSGGDAKTTFYTSGGYFNQKAVIIGSDFKRYSGNINIKHKANDKLSLGVNLNGSFSKQLSPFNAGAFRNPVLSGFFLRPSQNAYNTDGTANNSPATFNQVYNPIGILEVDREALNTVKTVSSFTGEYNLLRNLKFTSKFGVDYLLIEEDTYRNPFFGDARTLGGQVSNFSTRVSNWIWTNTMDYHHDLLNKDIGIDVKVGYEAQKTKQYNISARGNGLPQTTALPLPAPATPTIATATRSDFSFESVFSVLQLNYKSKYSLSGSIRRDGSSRFGSNNRYGTFWSVGGAWNLEQEDFMKNIGFVNALKLRASYGVNGNASIGNYDWRGTYSFASNYNLQSGSGPTIDGTTLLPIPGNTDLTWELNKPFDVGIDASFLKNRLSLTADYYVRTTSDLLLDDPLSGTSGYVSRRANIGEMENSGWEFSINGSPVKTKEFQWDMAFNITFNRNKVTKLRNNQDILALPFIRRVGEDVQSIFTRLWAGVDPANGNPLWYVDGTKSATTSVLGNVQRAIIGSAAPKGFGSFNNTFSYKGFSLDAQFNYVYGNLLNDNWAFIMRSDGAFPQLNKIRKQLARWQKPGDVAENPKYVYNNANNSNAVSSRDFYKGDYIRLRDLTLSYQVPKALLTKLKMDNATFYVRGTNLWTKAFDKELTFDPEQPANNGTNNLGVLIQRTISIGVTLGL